MMLNTGQENILNIDITNIFLTSQKPTKYEFSVKYLKLNEIIIN